MAVTRHFCNESLVSTALYADAESCCGESSCCHSESEFIQLDEDFHPAGSTPVPGYPAVDLIAALSSISVFSILQQRNEVTSVQWKPPAPPGTPEFLSLNQAYLL